MKWRAMRSKTFVSVSESPEGDCLWDDGVVVGDLLVVKDLLALADGGATEERAHQIEIGWDDEASQDTCDLGI